MALLPDPDLAPVAAAQAAIDATVTAPAQPNKAPATLAPAIVPAEPDRWSQIVALRYPLTVDGQRIETLTLRRLTAKALVDLLMEDDDAESLNRRARAAIAGVHPHVLEALDADDAVEVMDAIRPFLPRALQGAEMLELAAAARDAFAADAA